MSVVYIDTVHIVFSLRDLALVAKPQVMPITNSRTHLIDNITVFSLLYDE